MNRITRSLLPHRRKTRKNDIAQSPINIMLRDDLKKMDPKQNKL